MDPFTPVVMDEAHCLKKKLETKGPRQIVRLVAASWSHPDHCIHFIRLGQGNFCPHCMAPLE